MGIYCEFDSERRERRIWRVERLWKLAEAIEPSEVLIESIVGIDEVTWFSLDGPLPTCREIVNHCRRINNADFRYPILLTDQRRVFDGMHRIARAMMDGRQFVTAKIFHNMPDPDSVEPLVVRQS